MLLYIYDKHPDYSSINLKTYEGPIITNGEGTLSMKNLYTFSTSPNRSRLTVGTDSEQKWFWPVNGLEAPDPTMSTHYSKESIRF
jgi:hypothetical protein